MYRLYWSALRCYSERWKVGVREILARTVKERQTEDGNVELRTSAVLPRALLKIWWADEDSARNVERAESFRALHVKLGW